MSAEGLVIFDFPSGKVAVPRSMLDDMPVFDWFLRQSGGWSGLDRIYDPWPFPLARRLRDALSDLKHEARFRMGVLLHGHECEDW